VKRHHAAWLLAAALLAVYVGLHEAEESLPGSLDTERGDVETSRLEITDVMPHDAAAGSAVVVMYTGAAEGETAVPRVWAGKMKLRVLANRSGSVVAELPKDLHEDRVKLRIVLGNERSKSFALHIKAIDWRKPFRNLCGGFVLLWLGVGRMARAARSLSGSSTWRWTKRGPWQLAAVGIGGVFGAVMHSSTATAGILAGAVGSRVVALLPAAAIFLGAQLGAAAAPFLLTRASEPHEGLIAVAIGGLCLRLASDRRGRALAWLILSGGIVAFALQVLRPGFEPIVSNPTLLRVFSQLTADGLLGATTLVVIGTVLVVLFQGPAPVLVLALAIDQMLGHAQPRATLLLLSGSGLGSALGALLSTPFGPQGRRLAELNLLTGLCSTVLTALTVGVFDTLGQKFVAGAWPIYFGKHMLPDGASRVALAYGCSQIAVTLVLLALMPFLARFLERHASTQPQAPRYADATLRADLASALDAQLRALPALLRLSTDAERAAGREAEHSLGESDAVLRRVFMQTEQPVDLVAAGGDYRRAALAELQLQRALERVLKESERLTDERVAWAEDGAGVSALSESELHVLRGLYELMAEGLTSLRVSLSTGVRPDPDQTRAREIQINALEAQLRVGLSARAASRRDLARGLSIITLVDALETAGNQLYRLAEACAVPVQQSSRVSRAIAPLSTATRGGPC
jgi:Na+/phosphate symporter